MIRLAIDMDGCLAAFNPAFIKKIKEMFGVNLPEVSATYPDKWAYHKDHITAAENTAVWDEITHSPDFWLNLGCEPTAKEALQHLDARRTMYGGYWIEPVFITARPGAKAKQQTEKWLTLHGYGRPIVEIASEKAPVLLEYGSHVIIDDRPENLSDAYYHGPRDIQTLLIERPYNKWAFNEKYVEYRYPNILAALKGVGI